MNNNQLNNERLSFLAINSFLFIHVGSSELLNIATNANRVQCTATHYDPLGPLFDSEPGSCFWMLDEDPSTTFMTGDPTGYILTFHFPRTYWITHFIIRCLHKSITQFSIEAKYDFEDEERSPYSRTVRVSI